MGVEMKLYVAWIPYWQNDNGVLGECLLDDIGALKDPIMVILY